MVDISIFLRFIRKRYLTGKEKQQLDRTGPAQRVEPSDVGQEVDQLPFFTCEVVDSTTRLGNRSRLELEKEKKQMKLHTYIYIYIYIQTHP